ncbi:MAG: hypothetical protein M1831_003839 [Alyxoria varia]|nr:MAG: hypothetical protein M1831_003839 [Alyxoria varia]
MAEHEESQDVLTDNQSSRFVSNQNASQATATEVTGSIGVDIIKQEHDKKQGGQTSNQTVVSNASTTPGQGSQFASSNDLENSDHGHHPSPVVDASTVQLGESNQTAVTTTGQTFKPEGSHDSTSGTAVKRSGESTDPDEVGNTPKRPREKSPEKAPTKDGRPMLPQDETVLYVKILDENQYQVERFYFSKPDLRTARKIMDGATWVTWTTDIQEWVLPYESESNVDSFDVYTEQYFLLEEAIYAKNNKRNKYKWYRVPGIWYMGQRVGDEQFQHKVLEQLTHIIQSRRRFLNWDFLRIVVDAVMNKEESAAAAIQCPLLKLAVELFVANTAEKEFREACMKVPDEVNRLIVLAMLDFRGFPPRTGAMMALPLVVETASGDLQMDIMSGGNLVGTGYVMERYAGAMMVFNMWEEQVLLAEDQYH